MVGKQSDGKSSHIFQQCYIKCCKLQNINPLNCVIPSNGGKNLDFCVDRVKYAEWAPILNALSCDLSLQSIAIRCRQQVKTILEHVDCERLAKTVNKRAVILTKFMLTNLADAIAQCLSSNTLLTSLLIEGLPLKVPFINPLVEGISSNNSLQHIHLPRCLIGDAGCLAICNALRDLPNIQTLDLSSCDITSAGAGNIADVIKYQKIHRYSENWKHTLRYRLPELDTMSGLRRITLCGNSGLGDREASLLLEVLADDLWIKAVDLQWCGLSEKTAECVFNVLETNKTLTVLDLRHNDDLSSESLMKVRALLRENEMKREPNQVYTWLNGNGISHNGDKRGHITRSVAIEDKDRCGRSKSNSRLLGKSLLKKERQEELSERLAQEIAHRRQLEELNMRLIQQLRQMKRERAHAWSDGRASSADLALSDQSCVTSERSETTSGVSGSSSVTIDQNTLAYIQQAFKDIYTFIQNNQCKGECREEHEDRRRPAQAREGCDLSRPNILAKKAHSAHEKIMEHISKVDKITKSACLITDKKHEKTVDVSQGMFERQMGDTLDSNGANYQNLDTIMAQVTGKPNPDKRMRASSSTVSGSSDTLVHTPRDFDVSVRSSILSTTIHPRDVFLSSDEDD